MEYVLFFVIGATLVVVARIMVGKWDKERIRRQITFRGDRVLDIEWTPFGPGYHPRDVARIYRVRYIDRAGQEQTVHCKTSLGTGVYFAEDELGNLMRRLPANDRLAVLERENRRLREQVRQLQAGIRPVAADAGQAEAEEHYARQVADVLTALDGLMANREIAEIKQFIAHHEAVEGVRILAWLIEEKQRPVPVELRQRIGELLRGRIAAEDLPAGFRLLLESPSAG